MRGVDLAVSPCELRAGVGIRTACLCVGAGSDLLPCAHRHPWCRRCTRTSQPGVPRWFACTQASGTWSWSGQWDRYLWGEWHPRGLRGCGQGQSGIGEAHSLAIPSGPVTAGGRRSSVALTLCWTRKDSSTQTATAGRSWRGGGVTGGNRVVCDVWRPRLVGASADPLNVGRRG